MRSRLSSMFVLTPSRRFASDRYTTWITVEFCNMLLHPLKGEILIVEPKVPLFSSGILGILFVSEHLADILPSGLKIRTGQGGNCSSVSSTSCHTHLMETATMGLPNRIDSATKYAGSTISITDSLARPATPLTPDRI
jgi:hypothetical protein